MKSNLQVTVHNILRDDKIRNPWEWKGWLNLPDACNSRLHEVGGRASVPRGCNLRPNPGRRTWGSSSVRDCPRCLSEGLLLFLFLFMSRLMLCFSRFGFGRENRIYFEREILNRMLNGIFWSGCRTGCQMGCRTGYFIRDVKRDVERELNSSRGGIGNKAQQANDASMGALSSLSTPRLGDLAHQAH